MMDVTALLTQDSSWLALQMREVLPQLVLGLSSAFVHSRE